jgi:transcriptional regulator with XRE-family HTH domain
MIRTARKHLGESQEAFGARFGVQQPAISKWESEGPPTAGAVAILIRQFFEVFHVKQKRAR